LVVCGAGEWGQAVLMASQLKPDLIVLDFAMPMLIEEDRSYAWRQED
jgi:CheY-like chemotaxis protein